jgi:cytochrome c biogenesis protein CcmG/thiol:disulfide interchange protein DsbE
MTNINAGQPAPGFSLKGLDGKAYSLDSLMEKGPVVAAFFKISCPVCQFTFPFLQRLHQRYGDQGVTFLGISQDDAKSTAAFAREFGITFPMVLDEKEKDYPASNAYGLTNVPSIFLVDPDGTVRISSMGFVKKDLERIAGELSERRKMAPAPLFRPNESVPANKPG